MHITLSPMRCDGRLSLVRSGDMLSINGTEYDFSALPDGATLPRGAVTCDWLVSDVERIDGVIHLTLILPHGSEAPEETLFPSPVIVSADGPIALPHYEVQDEH